jgi:hypothetical protein
MAEDSSLVVTEETIRSVDGIHRTQDGVSMSSSPRLEGDEPSFYKMLQIS